MDRALSAPQDVRAWLYLENKGTAGQFYPLAELLRLADDGDLCGELSVRR